MPWRELQYFFACGKAICVSAELDLIDVATEISTDNKAVIKNWMATSKITHVSDKQAKEWFNNDTQVWATVVKPWVLVQYKADTSSAQ